MGRRIWMAAAITLAGLLAAGPLAADEEPGEDAALSEVEAAADVTGAEAAVAGQAPGAPLRISMDLQQASLKDVLKAFSQQAGINVIASAEVAEMPVTLYLDQVTVMDALDQILAAGDLTYERPLASEIYIVRRKDEDRPTLTRVYRLRYARVSQSLLAKASAAFGMQNLFEAQSTGAQAGGQAGVFGQAGPGGGRGFGLGGSSGESMGIDLVIERLLTDRGSVVVDGRTNRLILTDVPENFPRLEAALAALDVRTPQILIEAEVIETTLNKLKDLGFEWGAGSEGDALDFTPGSRSTRFPFQWLGTKAPGGPTAFTTSTLDFSDFKGTLQALQSDTDSKILARPKILTLDNESAVIRLTTEEAIGFETTTQETAGAVTAEPIRATTGVVLVVTPQVNEHGYITMLVEPGVTRTVAGKISAPSGQSDPRDPRTRSSRTLVRIPSGDTLVVGGLIDRTEEEVIRRVPVLSGIPFVGELFKNYEVGSAASELIVFVTPRILEEPSLALAVPGDTPIGLREQEPLGAKQEVMEQTLSVLERSQL